MNWSASPLRAAVLASAAAACLALTPPAPPADAHPVAARRADPWWRDAVCYELFVRSFADSDGDGVGDLRGLTSRLDYINDGDPRTGGDLGATCVWLMPIAQATSYHGYDVTDYFHVDSAYGTDEDFRRLVREAHRRGIRVLVDFVPNHTSREHPYFQAALRDTASPYRAWYRWSRTKPEEKGPWGQEVWHRSPVRDEWYYGVFVAGMPDLDYRNPAVRREFTRAAAHWVRALGADGLRMDAVPFLVEDDGRLAHTPETHAVLRDFARAVHEAAPGAFTVGEVWVDSTAIIARYYPDQLDAYFGFPVSTAILEGARTGSAAALLGALREANAMLPPGRWAPFTTNHDMPRVATTLGGDPGKLRLAAAAVLTLPGVPFLYYGEEIGMTGTKPDERIRTPMQWDATPGAGFTRGTPWEAPQPDWRTTNVAAQRADSASLLGFYRRLIGLRLRHPALRRGDLTLASASDSAVAAFVRRDSTETVAVVLNFGGRALDRLDVRFAAPVCGGASCRLEPLFGAPRPAGARLDGNAVTLRNVGAHESYVFRVVRD